MLVYMSTTTAGATIFYTKSSTDPAPMPTHNGLTPTGSTLKYTGPVSVSVGTERFFKAIAYKSGMIDSNPTTYDADNTGGGMAPIMGGAMSAQAMTMVTTTIYSVWDGDWAILEEYTTSNALVETYLQGYHGLVKTFVQNVYYYQDELGSTSHIADGIGALIESYQYDVYGKPRVYNSAGVYQAGATPVAKDLFTGQRWIVEIGLYDDHNRFMSPDLGRFLQPDPIGFKGDASNLYRYCGNDWANRTDLMGTDSTEHTSANSIWQKTNQDKNSDHDQLSSERGQILGGVGSHFTMQIRDTVKDTQGFSMNGHSMNSPYN